MLNAGFYTANNIAYSALTALVTRNENERVQLGSLRFVFAFTTSTIIQAVTFGLVAHFGNDAAAWRIVALIYVIIGIISNTISVLSLKELPEEENETKKETDAPAEKYSLREAASLLIKNKYYLLILGVYLLTQLYSAFTGVGTYYMTYVLGDANLLGKFATALNIPMIIGLLLVPTVVAKLGGMYRINYNMDAFLQLVKESGRSSWMYLQNISPTGAVEHQEVAVALALCDVLLQGRGAYRVHGGGFAGTVQAFVPFDMLDAFISSIEAVLGADKCHVLNIRPQGGIRVK